MQFWKVKVEVDIPGSKDAEILPVVTGSGRGTTPKTTKPLLLRILHCQVCFLSQNAKLSHPKHHENNTEAEASIVIYFYEVTILGPLLASSNYSKRTL